jgi:2-keto-3-deoxy-L-rhamnonate aldolase RhmA
MAAVDNVIAGCGRHGVAAGCGADSPDDVEDMIMRGMRFVFYPTTDLGILMQVYREAHGLMTSIAARTASVESA